jgi:cytochrome P450
MQRRITVMSPRANPQIPDVSLGRVPNYACDTARSLYGFFDQLREAHPVVRCVSSEGSWYAFLRAESAKTILLDTARFRTYHPDRGESGYFEEELLPASKDPPQHQQYRRLVQNAFGRQTARTHEGRIREFARQLVDRIAPLGECDYIRAFAGPYPGLVFLEVMQFPLEDLERLSADDAKFWTSPEADPDGSTRKAGLEGLRDYVRAQLAAKRATPDGSLLSELTTASIDGQLLRDDQIASYGLLACIGGMHTTKAVLGRLMLHLALHPGQRARLRDQPTLRSRFLDEILRVYAIGESFRFATEDVTVDGCVLRRGDRISVHWPAVNRDPREFSDPTTVNLDAPARTHFAFGHGAHFCIGMHLARHDMLIALDTWLERVPDFEIVNAESIRERVWGGAGLLALPLRWNV